MGQPAKDAVEPQLRSSNVILFGNASPPWRGIPSSL